MPSFQTFLYFIKEFYLDYYAYYYYTYLKYSIVIRFSNVTKKAPTYLPGLPYLGMKYPRCLTATIKLLFCRYRVHHHLNRIVVFK